MTLRPAVSAHEHAAGRVDAPLTLVEYGDYQFIDIDVRMPDIADDEFAEALRTSDKLYTTPVREGLAL